MPANVVADATLDRSFDVLAASVEGMAALVDVKALKNLDSSAFQSWYNFSEASPSPEVHMYSMGSRARLAVLRTAVEHPEVLLDTAVEIKTATVESTISAARAALSELQGARSSHNERRF